jgi:hypothetical protein
LLEEERLDVVGESDISDIGAPCAAKITWSRRIEENPFSFTFKLSTHRLIVTHTPIELRFEPLQCTLEDAWLALCQHDAASATLPQGLDDALIWRPVLSGTGP